MSDSSKAPAAAQQVAGGNEAAPAEIEVKELNVREIKLIKLKRQQAFIESKVSKLQKLVNTLDAALTENEKKWEVSSAEQNAEKDASKDGAEVTLGQQVTSAYQTGKLIMLEKDAVFRAAKFQAVKEALGVADAHLAKLLSLIDNVDKAKDLSKVEKMVDEIDRMLEHGRTTVRLQIAAATSLPGSLKDDLARKNRGSRRHGG